MFGLSGSDRSPIAIELHAAHLVAVQLIRKRGRWSPAFVVIIPRSAPTSQPDASTPAINGLSDAERAALGDALKRQGAAGRDVVLIAPPAATCTQLLELPPRTAATPINALARAEMARLSRWGEDEHFQLLTWDVPRPPTRAGSADAPVPTTLAAAAVPDSALLPTIETLAAAHWLTIGVVPASQAAAFVAANASEDRDAAGSIVITVAWDHASLTVTRGGTALYHRDLPDNGLSLLARGLTADLRLSPEDAAAAIETGTIGLDGSAPRAHSLCEGFAEALATEIEATLAFAARRYGNVAPGHLHVLGQGARIRGLAAALRTRLDMPGGDPQADHDAADALLRAAAMLAADPAYGPGLLPTAQRVGLHRDRLARRWTLAAASIAGAAGVSLACLYSSTIRPIGPQAARLDATQREQARVNAELGAIEHQLATVRAAANFRDRLATQPDFSALLRVVGSTVSTSTVLSELAILDPAAGAASAVRRLRIAGETADAAALNDEVSALRQLDVFNHVELTRTGRSVDGRGVHFELTLDLVTPASDAGPTGGAR